MKRKSKKREMKINKAKAISIILNLILATFAFAFLISLTYVEEVRAATPTELLNQMYNVGNYKRPASTSAATTPLPTSSGATTAIPVTASSSNTFTMTQQMADNYYKNYGTNWDNLVGQKVTFNQVYDGEKLITTLSSNGNTLPFTLEQTQALKNMGAPLDLTPMTVAQQQTLLNSQTTLGSLTAGQNLGNGLSVTSVVTNKDGITTTTFSNGQTLTGKSSAKVGDSLTPPAAGIDFLGNMWTGLQTAFLVAGGIQLLGTMMGLPSAQTNALSLAAFGGILAGKFAQSVVTNNWGRQASGVLGMTKGGFLGAGVGIVIGLIILQL